MEFFLFELAMAMRMDVFERPFRGGKTGPTFEAFWKKILVAGTLQKWDTDAKPLANLPLFLEDEAFFVWDELSDDDKKDRAKMYAAMQAAFSLSPAEAYERFTSRTLRMDESVASYAADLKNSWASRVMSPVMGKIVSSLNNSSLDSPASMPVKCA